MKLVGAGGQQVYHPLYDASGSIVTGGDPQLVLPNQPCRSMLLLQNLSAHTIVFEFGSARATATITNGVVTSVTVTNAGFNFTVPPVITFLGGGSFGNGAYLGLNTPDGPAPSHPAQAHAVLTGGAVSSIVVDDGGAGYVIAPYVLISNSPLDPYGAALPADTPGGGSIELATATAPLLLDGTCCPTDPIAVISANTGDKFTCRWMD